MIPNKLEFGYRKPTLEELLAERKSLKESYPTSLKEQAEVNARISKLDREIARYNFKTR